MKASLKDIRVLKHSSSYLIFAGKRSGKDAVYKIAHQNGDKLLREVHRIKELKATYPLLTHRLPDIVEQGRFESGVHQGKHYYVQSFFEGRTLSKYVQSCYSESETLISAFRQILKRLVDIVLGHSLTPAYDQGSGQFLKEAIFYEYERLQLLANLQSFTQLPEVLFNGERCDPLNTSLRRIFNKPAFQKLNESTSFISPLGHWNFHGDNLLLQDLSDPESFRIIDPDTNLDECDPLFSLARFFYSFLHDTADYDQYLINSQFFVPYANPVNKFAVKYTWPEIVHRNYAFLFNAIYTNHEIPLFKLDKRFRSKELSLRLRLNFLYCLLRGVNANYLDRIDFVDGWISEFRNKSLFLLLNATHFAHRLAEETT